MSITEERLISSGKTQAQEATFLEALAQALDEAMADDDRVFIIGEDVGVYGGAFKVTKGLLEKYGPRRVVDAPLAEEGFIGLAVGAALMGLRPIVEVQYADFISCGWDQIVNVAAKLHYRTGDAVPLVVRGPSGAGLRAGPFHSQSPEGWFAHTPGLKVVVPGTPFDAKGLLTAAIKDPNPVIFFEHKYLYRRLKERLPEDRYEIPLGKARVRRSGEDISIFTYGAMTAKALDAAAAAAEKGISVEVVDLRTIKPLDKEAVFNSVKKTSRALVLTEDNYSFGVAAEVAATVTDTAFDYLDAPVVRIAPPDVPIPYSGVLEDAYLPQTETVLTALNELVSY